HTIDCPSPQRRPGECVRPDDPAIKNFSEIHQMGESRRPSRETKCLLSELRARRATEYGEQSEYTNREAETNPSQWERLMQDNPRKSGLPLRETARLTRSANARGPHQGSVTARRHTEDVTPSALGQ